VEDLVDQVLAGDVAGELAGDGRRRRRARRRRSVLRGRFQRQPKCTMETTRPRALGCVRGRRV